MIDAWDEDHICSSCIQPSFFAHECNPNDASVIAHVPHVRQTIASTPLLQYIENAHKPHNTSLQASNSVSMNTSFSSKLRGRVRIALEINLLYIDTRQATTNLTSSQIMIHNQIVMHNHYAKMIRKPNIVRMMLATAAVMRITIVSLTRTTRYTAMIQASNDNQRH